MMRTTQAIAAVCAALALASCGGDDGEPIPERRAATLERLLQQVQRQSDAGSCTTLVEATIPRLENEAERLPESVGSDTRETIDDGIAHLRDLAETDCAEKEQDELPTTDETTTSETTTPETTPETTTPETTTETTTPEETTPEETTPPDDEPDPDPEPNPNPDPGGNGGTPPGQGGTPPGQGKKGDQLGGVSP